MEIYKVCFTLVPITLTVFSPVASGDEFAKACKKIEKAKPNIYNNTFCKQIAEGREEKLACRNIEIGFFWFVRGLSLSCAYHASN